jgi:hypothetical protein
MNPRKSTLYYPKTKRRYQYCDTCGTLLPAPGFYCVLCAPPEASKTDFEKGLSFSQSCLRITLLTLIFMVVALFQLNIDPVQMIQEQDVVVENPLKIAEDEDYKIVFKVNVGFANLRDEPNSTTSTIIFVITKGTRVEILDKKGKWSKIRTHPRPGDQARTGWLANSLLGSEIK